VNCLNGAWQAIINFSQPLQGNGADETFSNFARRSPIRTIPALTPFLFNQLLVDTIYVCYTFSVTSKRSSSSAAILNDDIDDELSSCPSNR
jgi:hypothetical protein